MQYIKKNKVIKIFFSIFAIALVLIFFKKIRKSNIYIDQNLPTFTNDTIKEFNGINLNKPVYIAYDGLVYDVSPSREKFYNKDKTYNYLAGRDSTKELNIAGGSIIKNKYKVVGRFIKN